jgi:YHS domain-containing protein
MSKILITALALICTMGNLQAQNNLPVKHFNLEKGLAIQGYDPVAYFMQHKAVKGNPQFAFTDEGVTYYFSSASSKEIFQKEPKKYEPQYGGWCAYAMGASGEKVEVDPETFTISNGKLYLFYHTWVNNTLNKWNKDEMNLKANADKNWKNIYH